LKEGGGKKVKNDYWEVSDGKMKIFYKKKLPWSTSDEDVDTFK